MLAGEMVGGEACRSYAITKVPSSLGSTHSKLPSGEGPNAGSIGVAMTVDELPEPTVVGCAPGGLPDQA